MSKVNSTSYTPGQFDETTKLAGGYGLNAAVQPYEQLLRRTVLACLLWEDNAYADGKSVADTIAELIPSVAPNTVASIAEEARTKQKLRHIPLFIASEMAKHQEHNKMLGTLLPKIITRADMLTDFLAIYWKDGRRKLTNQVKKGLASAFHNFDEYQFAKYDRDAKIKLKDVMFMCHPKPNNNKEEELFKKIANRNLETPMTWEVMLSAGADKKQTWTNLIHEKKIGGLAMLRNISNMKKAEVDGCVIREGISNLKSSMLLPLDFYRAWDMNKEFGREIEDAMQKAYANLPKLPGKTLFILDVSGSMDARISGRSNFRRKDCANALAMLAANQCEDFKLVVTAGDDLRRIHRTTEVSYPSTGFEIFNQVASKSDIVGWGGIFTRQCLEWCKKNISWEKPDRIVVFSDSQDCDNAKILPSPYGVHNYIIDVGSEKRGINYQGVWTAEISGWSEHFLTYIAAYEGLDNAFTEEESGRE